MLTVGEVARRCGLSRSTLLYYDRIGLLRPSGRSRANYRLYAPTDLERLARINTFREAGVPLGHIRALLDAGTESGGLKETLERRLDAINEQIHALRGQQRLIAGLLSDRAVLHRCGALDKAGWVAVLRGTGMSEDDMARWHAEFERLSPAAHEDFLRSLGIGEAEIEEIRARARAKR